MSWELLNQCVRNFNEREKKKAEAATAVTENAIDGLPVENQVVNQDVSLPKPKKERKKAKKATKQTNPTGATQADQGKSP